MIIKNMLLWKPKIYFIEINDKKINKEICEILYETQKRIADLTRALHNRDIAGKKQDTEELIEYFLRLKEEIHKKKTDLDKIINIELEKENYIMVNDKRFINDKKEQLKIMEKNLDDLIEILQENPTLEEYNNELIRTMTIKLHEFSKELMRIKNDDKALSIIYKTICGL